MTSSPHNPVKEAAETPVLRHALESACATRGLSVAGAKLIHHYSNAVYLLPGEDAVARITHGGDLDRTRCIQGVVHWLEYGGVAATAPRLDAEAVAVDETTTVSFWSYYPQPEDGREFSSAHLARILKDLHEAEPPPVLLEHWKPLTSLSAVLDAPEHAEALAPDDLAWLRDLVIDVQARVQALDSPLGHGLIHGDAWAGNLLWNTTAGPDAAVLGDWDWVSIGPREVDLVPTWHAARRYGKGPEWTATFATVYGYDLARWDGIETLLLMRDLMQITGPLRRAGDSPVFGEVLRERLAGVKNGSGGSWRGL
ncbi:phosphotransferase [Longispora urticae]